MQNGDLQRGYVHKYENKMWTIKYVNEVPAEAGSREQVLGEEAVDLQTLNQRIERQGVRMISRELRPQDPFSLLLLNKTLSSRASLQLALITGT